MAFLSLAIVILILLAGLFAFLLLSPSFWLPEPRSTYVPFGGPAGFYDSEYGTIDVTLEEARNNTTLLTLNLLPSGYSLYRCRSDSNLNEFLLIYSSTQLSDLKRETIFSTGSIVQQIFTIGSGSPYFSDSWLKNYMEDLMKKVNGSSLFRIGDGNWFGYGYIVETAPWGENGVRIMLTDGTFVGISACLPKAWIEAIADHLSIEYC